MAISKITTTSILDATIATADIADSAISTAKIASGAVTSAKTTDVGGVAGSPMMVMIGDDGGQSLANGTFTKLTTFTAEDNSDGLYDTSSNTVTIPSGKGGTYFISVMTNMTTNTDFDEMVLRIRKNGSDFLYSSIRNESQETNSIIACRTLAAGDVLELNGYHNRGSNGSYNGQSYRVNYTIFRLTE